MNDKLIVALDFPDITVTKNMVNLIGDEVDFYKIGLELMMSNSYFELVEWLKKKNKKIFCDLKLYDISETVARAVKNLSQYDIDLLTIHSASCGIMEKTAENKGKMQVIAVTVLTNLDQKDLNEMGFDPRISMEDLVLKRAAMAIESGLDGVVASGIAAKTLRKNLGNDFLIVSPGIRLERVVGDDQKQVCDVKTAINNGSSYLVVGRPITRDANPREAARRFNILI